MTYSDEALVNLLQQGDRGAFDQIYERYWQTLYQSAFLGLNQPAQAEDIVQELFIGLWVKRAEYHIENLSAYLRKAMKSRVLNYIVRDQGKESFFEPFESILQASFQAEELIREKELLQLVAAYVGSLPAKRREIFLLHYQYQLNTREIAEALHISPKTVQNQLNTAIVGLKSAVATILVAALTQHL
jgi:RNA polymerase sigma-70 factor (family 1)